VRATPPTPCRPAFGPRIAGLHGIAALLGTIATCVVTVGCGGSSLKSGTRSPTAAAQQLAFSKCMRTHGVPDFPDPGAPPSATESSFGGIAIPPTIDMQSPAFKAAQANCVKLLQSAPPGAIGQSLAGLEKQLLETSQCMRAHGVPGFPDPTNGPSSSGPGVSGGSDGRVVSLVIPSTIDVNSAAFEQAATACHFREG
jgi:hypothetical protein